MDKVTFLVAIDSYINRKGIVSILKNLSGTRLMLDTDNPDVFKNQVKEQMPDFIIISAAFFNRARQFYLANPDLLERTISLKNSREELTKDQFLAVLYISDSKQEILTNLEGLVHPFLSRKKEQPSSILSEREITVLKHIAIGLTNKQIADKLFLSLHTVTTHRKNIGNKLGIKSVSGLTVYAIVNNIISIEDIANTTSL